MRFRHSYIVPVLLLFSMTAAAQQNRPVLSQTSATGVSFTPGAPPEVTGGSNPSYIRSFRPLVPTTNAAGINMATPAGLVKKQEVFLDGLQRSFQSISYDVTEINGQGRNLVQLFDNRAMQEQYSFLPYAVTGGGLQANAYTQQQSFYSSLYPNEDYTPFSKTINSNTNNERSVTSYTPGKSGVGLGYGVYTKSILNTASQVIIWDIDGSGMPVANGFYAAGMLAGTESSAPDGAGSNSSNTAPRSRIYNDRDGRTILKMVWDGVSSYKYTYYVYDVKGKLRCTITPQAFKYYQTNSGFTNTVVNNLCFLYRYDAKGRPQASHKPGEEGFTWVVYDRKDRVVMRQSPNEGPNKWELTFYDAWGRVKATSLFTDNGSLSAAAWQTELDNAAISGSTPGNVRYHIGTAAGEAVYPADNTIANNVMMTYAWYDDYSVVDPTGNRKTAMQNRLNFTETLNTSGAEYVDISRLHYGLPTGSRVRILTAAGADATKTGQWRNSIVYYDKKGRVTYTQASDVYNSDSIHHDYGATQYDFSNRMLITKHLLVNNNSTDGKTNRIELTRNDYHDVSSALHRIMHKIDNGPWKAMSVYAYDELGRVKRKTIGAGAETQDFAYNIRGQLTGINKDYAETGAKGGLSRTFGQSLKYDFGFERPRYDGKIAGMVWRGSASGDMMAYGYDYFQDGALKFADYNKFQINTWTHTFTDYTVKDQDYDKNGNLKAMTQKGMKPGAGIVNMDILSYNYENSEYSNRLAKVTDGGIANYGAGDFNDGPLTGGIDYQYDAAGNLTHDENKGINHVTYTHFNKPEVVSFANGSVIRYSYDASGNKVQEILSDVVTSTTKTTDYLGNFIYEDNKLQYSLTNDGRTRYDNSNHTYKEEFFVKDHLGNVRSTVELTGYDLTEYLATYELASANLENLVFEYIDEVRDDKPGTGDVSMAANLNGAESGRRIGTSMLMHVMAGDMISLNVDNYYESFYKEYDAPVSPEDMLAGIVTTLVGGNGGLGGSDAHDPGMADHTFTPENFAIYDGLVEGNYDNNRPKAFLNYVLFDENLKVVNTMSGAFQVTGDGAWTEIGTTEPMEIPKNGYLAVYLSNASTSTLCLSCSDVYFDDLKVKISKGKLLEENHYYPHGLPMYGLGSTASGYKSSGRKYQSNEYNTELNLNWMDFNFRQYDPQIGRFLGVDPLADMYGQDMFSPYAAMGNMPESLVDPDGLDPRFPNPKGAAGVVIDRASAFGPSAGGAGGGGALAGSIGNPSSLAGLLKQFNYHSLGDFLQKSSADEVKREEARKNAAITGATSNASGEKKGSDAFDNTANMVQGTIVLNEVTKVANKNTVKNEPNSDNLLSQINDTYGNLTFLAGIALSFTADTKMGKSLAMGGSFVFSSSTYSRQKALISEAKMTGQTIKIAGNALGLIGLGLTAVDIYDKGVNVNNGLDGTFGVISFIPGAGWMVGAAYFIGNAASKELTGKSIGDHGKEYVSPQNLDGMADDIIYYFSN